MGISRDKWHKRRATGGKRAPIRMKRKFELGRQPAMTKLGERRVHQVRARGGYIKFRALKLDHGNYAWPGEAVTRKARIISVVYNPTNPEYVRTNTIVKGSVVQIDATPFKNWYQKHYGVVVGKAGKFQKVRFEWWNESLFLFARELRRLTRKSLASTVPWSLRSQRRPARPRLRKVRCSMNGYSDGFFSSLLDKKKSDKKSADKKTTKKTDKPAETKAEEKPVEAKKKVVAKPGARLRWIIESIGWLSVSHFLAKVPEKVVAEKKVVKKVTKKVAPKKDGEVKKERKCKGRTDFSDLNDFLFCRLLIL